MSYDRELGGEKLPMDSCMQPDLKSIPEAGINMEANDWKEICQNDSGDIISYCCFLIYIFHIFHSQNVYSI